MSKINFSDSDFLHQWLYSRAVSMAYGGCDELAMIFDLANDGDKIEGTAVANDNDQLKSRQKF
ncbi:MAG: hypothetical protein GW903_09620 [Alphaproteobacteria bacterium]|nr:hypothetical protein [Alphaproteobacteria bacterium]NCQ89196.1 hypothetical protein [Alphaproteobacteria bacterium]NCT08128.1 hypothetical protein [Alphaproteobacteria bacterium]